jgi:CRISPR-associated endonuclease/helicase Cas3
VGAELLERDGRLLAGIAALSGFSGESLRTNLPFLLALHDLGKFSEPFQDQRPEIVEALQGARPPRGSTLRHDTMGYLLWRSWGARRPDPREATLLPQLHSVTHADGEADRRDLDEMMQSWMAAILGHHGKPPEEGRLPVDVFKCRADAALARSREDAPFALAAIGFTPGARKAIVDALIARMKRLVVGGRPLAIPATGPARFLTFGTGPPHA